MQPHTATLALTILGSIQVASSHIMRTPLESAAGINDMDDTAAPAVISPAEFGLQTRSSVPHDVPDHPHCTYKGKDSIMYMVFSKDFGRHDDTSRNGCGNLMLSHLREGTFKLRSPCIPLL